MEKQEFKTILTYDDVMNIQDVINWQGIWVKIKSILYGSKWLFWCHTKKKPHAAQKYGRGKFKFEVGSYWYTYCSPGELAHTRQKNWKIRLRSDAIFLNISILTACNLLVMKNVKNWYGRLSLTSRPPFPQIILIIRRWCYVPVE